MAGQIYLHQRAAYRRVCCLFRNESRPSHTVTINRNDDTAILYCYPNSVRPATPSGRRAFIRSTILPTTPPIQAPPETYRQVLPVTMRYLYRAPVHWKTSKKCMMYVHIINTEIFLFILFLFIFLFKEKSKIIIKDILDKNIWYYSIVTDNRNCNVAFTLCNRPKPTLRLGRAGDFFARGACAFHDFCYFLLICFQNSAFQFFLLLFHSNKRYCRYYNSTL